MNETDLQNKIRIALSEHGICIRMNTGTFKTEDGRTIKQGIAGMPDIVWVGPGGRMAWIEVKTEKGRATEKQKRFIARLIEMGHAAGVARSVEDALHLIGEE